MTTQRIEKLRLYASIFRDNSPLNQSDDFSGGCTPFKKSAQRGANLNVAHRKTMRSTARKGASKSSKERRVERADENSAISVCGKSEIDEGDCTRTEQNSLSAGDGTLKADEFKIGCLDATTLQTSKLTPVSPCMERNTQMVAASSSETVSDDVMSCVTCGQLVATVDKMEHLKRCLHKFKHTSASAQPLTPPTVIDEPSIRCFICQAVLTGLSSHARECHINRCLDQAPKGDVTASRQASAPTPHVLDCPLCGQKLKSATSRRSHLKKCAAKHKVDTRLVLDRVREQEENAMYAALNVGSGVTIPKPSRVAVKRKRSNKHIDEDTQLAIALSTSLKEEMDRQLLSPEPPVLTNAFSLLMSPKRDTRHAKHDKKKRPPLMTLQNEEEIQCRRNEKVAALLLPQQDTSDNMSPNTDCLQQSELAKRYADKSVDCCSLWEKASLLSVSVNVTSEFYVASLVPPLPHSHLAAGSKLRRMSCIPGWQALETQSPVDIGKQQPSSQAITEPLMTQTTLVLAELASEVDSPAVNPLDVTSGFCLPPQPSAKEISAQDNLINAMAHLVNDPTSSDLKVTLKGGLELHAHSLIVKLRCPRLMELLNSAGSDFVHCDPDVMLTVLHFIYTARLTVPHSLAKDARLLAQRLDLPELVAACDEILATTTPDDLVSPGSPRSQESKVDGDLQVMLHKLWGSDDEAEVVAEDVTEAVRYSAEMDELYAFTQRQRQHPQPTEDALSLHDNGDTVGDASSDTSLMSPIVTTEETTSASNDDIGDLSPVSKRVRLSEVHISLLAQTNSGANSPCNSQFSDDDDEPVTDMTGSDLFESFTEDTQLVKTTESGQTLRQADGQVDERIEDLHSSGMITEHDAEGMGDVIELADDDDDDDDIYDDLPHSISKSTDEGQIVSEKGSSEDGTKDDSIETVEEVNMSDDMIDDVDDIQNEGEHEGIGHDEVKDENEVGEVEVEGEVKVAAEVADHQDEVMSDANEDLWEDFGYVDEFSFPLDDQMSLSEDDEPSKQKADTSTTTCEADTGNQCVVVDSDSDSFEDPPTFIEGEEEEARGEGLVVSHMGERMTGNEMKQTLKTPISQKKAAGRPVVVLSPLTPMANYIEMNTPQLKNACDKIGVKALPRKRMVKLLQHVYEETHIEKLANQPTSSASDHQVAAKHGKRTAGQGKSSKTKTSDKPSSASEHTDWSDSEPVGDDIKMAESRSPAKGVSRNDIHYKQQQIRRLFTTDERLYVKVLHYEPLELDAIHSQLKQSGHNIGMEIIKDFLDEQNIVYTNRESFGKKFKSSNSQKSKKARKGATAVSPVT